MSRLAQLAARPPRRMPSAANVAAYWHEQGEPFTVNPAAPACFGCQVGYESWRDLERCHLIDRMAGGLDGSQNLAMLCDRCHSLMPPFRPGDEQAAIQYLLDGGSTPVLMRMVREVVQRHQASEGAAP